jgi:hypothetical protein
MNDDLDSDFGDLPEDEDFKSGSEKWDIFLDDCVVTLIIEEDGDRSFEISRGDRKTNADFLQIFKCFLANRGKARGPLEIIRAAIEDWLTFFPMAPRGIAYKECLELTLEVIDGRRTIDDLKNKAEQVARKLLEYDFLNSLCNTLEYKYSCMDTIFLEYGIVRWP